MPWVVPVCGYELKIAVVPGATPFLVSNTLLRALGGLDRYKRKSVDFTKTQSTDPTEVVQQRLVSG